MGEVSREALIRAIPLTVLFALAVYSLKHPNLHW
jgi:hypothetical protein